VHPGTSGRRQSDHSDNSTYLVERQFAFACLNQARLHRATCRKQRLTGILGRPGALSAANPRGSLVVVSSLQDYEVIAIDQIDQAVFLADAA
jgi:hypothetical protein